MNDSLKNLQNFAICILILAVLTLGAYFIAPTIKPVAETGLDNSAQAIGIHFFVMGLGVLLVLGICYQTRDI